MKDCNLCGKCCINYSDGGLVATQQEIDDWEAYQPHIFRYVRNGKIWIDPATGKQLTRCPWLRALPDRPGYSCDIYQDRPDDCRQYPVSVSDMVKDECEMLEVKDYADLKRAQLALNKR